MTQRDSVAALFESDGLIFLAKRNSGGQMGGRWELPGGKCESGESLEQALQREIMEELGIACTIGTERTGTTFVHHDCLHTLHVFSAAFQNANDIAQLDSLQLVEHSDYAWFNPQLVLAMGSEVVDSDLQVIRTLFG